MAENKNTGSKKPAPQNKRNDTAAKSAQGTAKGSASGNKASGAKTPSQAVKKPTKENEKVTLPSERVIHQVIPYILFVLALFLVVLMFLQDVLRLEEPLGVVGHWINSLLFGLFGWGSFLMPFFVIYLGARWGKIMDSHRMGIKLLLGGLTILIFSALAQVFVKFGDYDIGGLWSDGVDVVGGGIIGGTLGWLCRAGLKTVGSLIILIAALFLLLIFFFDLTPKNVWTWIRYRRKLRAERIARERAQYVQHEQREQYEQPERVTGDDYAVGERGALPAGDGERRRLRIRKKGEPKEDFDAEPYNSDDYRNAVIVEKDKAELYNMPSAEPEPTVKESEPTVKESESEKFTLNNLFVDPVAAQTEANDENDGAEAIEVDADMLVTPEPLEGEDGQMIIPWIQPPISLLKEPPTVTADQSTAIAATMSKLRQTLESFDIRISDIGYSVGPTITRYEVVPQAGVRVRAIANLVDDIAMNLATEGVRIEAPIPNKPAVGVEVPNSIRSNVYLRSLIDNDMFWKSSALTVCLGQDVTGKNIYFDIKKMPHMIIAGTTGSGKSVCINCIVCSLLYKNPPDKVKLIMIDPKKVEFNVYQHIPHLYCPIIIDMKKAAGALASAVAEMERRYSIIEDVGVRDVDSYNQITARDPDREYLPKLIIVIDELADLMMTAKQDVEGYIQRIAAKARAIGIHLIIGTQRPSVDVITGLIKANVPSRIACTVKSQVDSRTIIDIAGAEKLIGHGDMLFSPIGMAKPIRVQGAFLEDAEVISIVDFIKSNNAPVDYNRGFMDQMESAAAALNADKKGSVPDIAGSGDSDDDKFRQALKVAVNEGKISTSLLQRKLSIGYGKAAKLIDQMEEMGYVSEPDGNKPRRVTLTKQEYFEKVANDDLSSGETE